MKQSTTAAAAAPLPATLETVASTVAWVQFEHALASALASLDEASFLIVSVKTPESEHEGAATDNAGAPYYVQFAPIADGLWGEAVSDRFLAEARQLDVLRRAALHAIGWQAPNADKRLEASEMSPNYFRVWNDPVPFDEVAAMAGETLRDIFGASHPGGLCYAARTDLGEVIELPDLGIDWDESDAPFASIDDGASDGLLHPENPAQLQDAVARTLRELLGVDELTVDEDGDIRIDYRTATVYVQVLDDVPIVRLVSVIASNVRPSTPLFTAVNDLNRTHNLVRAFVFDTGVILSADVVSSPYVPEHFRFALRTISEIADAVNGDFRAQFSGRYADTLGGYL